MTIQTEIIARLEADSPLIALIVDRIHPEKLPQNPTYPAVKYQTITEVPSYDLAGADGRVRTRMQFMSLSETAIATAAVGDAIRVSLSGFRGTLTTLDAWIRLDNQFSGYEQITRLYTLTQDFLIMNSE